MDLELKRKFFTDESTIGELSINGFFECLILEDKDRGLTQNMSLTEIGSKKIHGKTAIPLGKYQVVISFSDRFQKYLPLLVNVPGFEGIRIHPGNTAVDTEGCLLPGKDKGDNMVGQSRVAFASVFSRLKAVERKEKIFINITH